MPTHFEIVRRSAELYGDRLALISEEDGARTYSELIDASARVAFSMLNELGLSPGARIGLWGVNRPEWIEVFLACSAAGFTCYQINPSWTVAEASETLSAARVEVLVHDHNLTVRAHALRVSVPTIRHAISIGAGSKLTLDALKELAPPESILQLPPIVKAPPPPFFFTSGTTGRRSKAVVKSPDHVVVPVQLDKLFNLTCLDRVLVVTPFFHSNGNAGAMLTLAFGGSVVFSRRFSANRFWSLVDRYRPTFFFTLSSIVTILMARPPSPLESDNSIKNMVAVGVAPIADAVEERFGLKAIDWYGGTEIGACAYTPIDEPRRAGAVGKLFPGVDLRILNENLAECGPGEVGEIALPTNAIPFREYAGDPAATAEVIRGDWFMTGDLGYLDADKWLYFVDRTKDIVRRGGENISSLEVETVLQEHPAICEVAIVPRPDPVLGEKVTAFIVPKAGQEVPSVKALRTFASRRLALFKIPDLVIAAESLPRTLTGKLRKAVLKETLRRHEPPAGEAATEGGGGKASSAVAGLKRPVP